MKKKPQRTCLGCRTAKNKDELLRIVRTPSGSVVPDPDRKIDGRGAYICRHPDCLKRVIKSRALSRSLKCEVPEEVYIRLQEVISS